jgi:transposase-like protein
VQGKGEIQNSDEGAHNCVTQIIKKDLQRSSPESLLLFSMRWLSFNQEGSQAMTAPKCPKCGANDSRVFPLVKGWVQYVCPKCSFLWEVKEETKTRLSG